MLQRQSLINGKQAGRFVETVETGLLESCSDAHYCKIGFNLSAYSDFEYVHYGIKLPDQLLSGPRKRRAEYLAGRICCKKILEQLGNATSEVTSQFPEREPCWPPGTTGSISHSGFSAIAVITRKDVGWVGVDIEELHQEQLIESAELFTSTDERHTIFSSCNGSDTLTESHGLLLAFSAKETLFKALYPSLQFYFGFECAVVESIDIFLRQLILRLNTTLSALFHKGLKFTVNYAFTENNSMVITTIVVVNPCP